MRVLFLWLDSVVRYGMFKTGLTKEVEEMNKINSELLEKEITRFVHETRGVFRKNVDSIWFSVFGANVPIEIIQRHAKELGYINGYRWGVEYPTNGEKPDLPSDVKCSVKFIGNIAFSLANCSIDNWPFDQTSHFKITDERYKPADTGYLENNNLAQVGDTDVVESEWYDYEAQKAVALPPVGEKVEVFLHWSESWSGWVVIVGHDHDGAIWRNGSDNKSYIYSPRSEIRPLDYAKRKAEAEKLKVVAEAQKHCRDLSSHDLRALYDAGYLRTPSK